MDEIWVVYNGNYGEVKTAHSSREDAQEAAVAEHNRLYEHNGPDYLVEDYEELEENDSNVIVLGPATFMG